ncbi:MAG: FHA domain-containing protein [Syntrophotaleaceae bacterium]
MIKKRSIIIDGGVTSISMEPIFWDEIDRRADRMGLPWQEYMRRLLSEVRDAPNRSAAVREALVNLLRDESMQAKGHRMEAWWLLRTPSGEREVCTRGFRLFVGRTASNDIVVDDPEVSRKHFMLAFDGDRWWAVDLGSKNGIRLYDNRIPSVRMEYGVSLEFGKSRLVLLG